MSISHVWLNVMCTVHYDGLYCGSVCISKCVGGCHRLILLSGDPACTLKASEACWASIMMPFNAVAEEIAAHMQFRNVLVFQKNQFFQSDQCSHKWSVRLMSKAILCRPGNLTRCNHVQNRALELSVGVAS